MNYKRKSQRPSKQTDEKLALEIIKLANNHERRNKRKYIFKIACELSIRVERVKLCLKHACYFKQKKYNNQQPWKFKIKRKYNLDNWRKNVAKNKYKRNQKNIKQALQEAAKISKFIKETYDRPLELELSDGRIFKRYVRRSANDYLYQYYLQNPHDKRIGKSTIYRLVNAKWKGFSLKYFVRLYKCYGVRTAKQNFHKLSFAKIDQQPLIPAYEVGHYQGDSVIGKSTDKKALATIIDVNTGKVSINLYDRKAKSFAEHVSRATPNLKSLRIDNGTENSKLGKHIDPNKIFTCHVYSSWEKGAIENMHRLIRMVWPKGWSMNKLTENAVKTIEEFVNNYYRPRFIKTK